MPAATSDIITLDDVRAWAPAVNVEQAARALGVSRSGLYQSIAEGTCPVATITVGRRIKVLTHSLVGVLEGNAAKAASASPTRPAARG